MHNTGKRVFVTHLLNDFSGSPNICRQVTDVLIRKGYRVTIITSSAERTGFLGGVEDATYKIIPYRWSKFPIATFFRYFMAQLRCFLYLLKEADRQDFIYVSTILPVGALLAGKFRKIPTLCHVHEACDNKSRFQRLLFWVLNFTGVEKMFVSEYAATSAGGRRNNPHILYNSVRSIFFEEPSAPSESFPERKFRVIMACSLKEYKGVYEFLRIASGISEVDFHLVLNTDAALFTKFLAENAIPDNVKVDANVKNIWELFRGADLVMNLSLPEQFVETFGLTLVEGMACGKPVIAPPVGGVVEFVEDGVNGFLVDARNTKEITEKIAFLMQNEVRYRQMSEKARQTAERFRPERFEGDFWAIFMPFVSTS